MIKRTFATLLILCLLLPAFAQQSLLYKISGKGLKQPSYVYGTIHLICPDDFFLSAPLQKAFDQSKSVYLEIDMDDPAMMATMLGRLQEKDEQYSLEKAFTPQDYRKLTKYMKDSMGMDVNAFKKMKPLVILSMILPKMLNCPTAMAYETKFVSMAKEQQKEILGLEALDDQIDVFDAFPDTLEARMIMDYINDLPKQKAIYSKLVAAYKKQDITRLHNLLGESPEFAGYEDKLVYDRNRNWIPVMEKAMQQETVLFGCGAMHLGGDQGVVELLRKKGYKVEPVTK
ncbi:TraB/GumN family protein [Chitinophaga barathri]|uniref:TraB/GumN family protein n=1 Tax=Chitinophaga barathri TaxID=1647451 RepID=A0A3N4M5Q6_9BACT|nr:TraB/GumN family protein [Chitinophaga barathri]RPD38345.1 TraB/GumN family protein [Chitinophaga barathri]